MRLTFDALALPGNESIGLVGGSYLLEPKPWFYVGLGAYGAVTGRRGGFFIGGFEAGVRRRLGDKTALDAGLFMGGGGGGGAPQGGGLMLRPHVGLLYELDGYRVGANLSRVYFPNGGIDSSQFALSVERPLAALFGNGWLEGEAGSRSLSRLNNGRPPGSARRELAQTIRSYLTARGTRGTDGLVNDRPIGLLGFAYTRFRSRKTYFSLEMAGAASGSVDGYADVFVETGYRTRLTGKTILKTGLGLGAGGGGAVDTGGGLLTRLTAGLQHRFRGGWLSALDLGYVVAPNGGFRAGLVGVSLGYGYSAPSFSDYIDSPAADNTYQPRHWRLRAAQQSYFPQGDTRRKNGVIDGRRIDLAGLRIDAMFTRNAYFTSQAMGAANGGAGGYATGLVGAGWNRSLDREGRLRFNAELMLGAAGGGGIAVGDGFVLQSMLGLDYALSPRLSLMLSGGGIKAVTGWFEAGVLELALVARFTTLEQR